MHSPHSLVDTILVAACLGAGRQGYCELGTVEYGSILVLYKLHVMDTLVCGSSYTIHNCLQKSYEQLTITPMTLPVLYYNTFLTVHNHTIFYNTVRLTEDSSLNILISLLFYMMLQLKDKTLLYCAFHCIALVPSYTHTSKKRQCSKRSFCCPFSVFTRYSLVTVLRDG